MPLGLDLSESDAKIARARVHLETLQREIPVAIAKRKPFTARLSEIDPNSGWCLVFFTSNSAPEHDLGVIVGDLVHNLRCALDYIIAKLVGASGATLEKKHQFPISTSLNHYTKWVGTAALPVAGGPLGGIKYGLQEIFALQPFHRKPSPEDDRLVFVQRFSNADKHRIISEVIPLLQPGSAIVEHDGIVLEQSQSPNLPNLKPNIEYEIARMRFAKPYPTKVSLEGNVSVEIFFGTPAIGHHVKGEAIDVLILQEMCEHVAMIAYRFKKL